MQGDEPGSPIALLTARVAGYSLSGVPQAASRKGRVYGAASCLPGASESIVFVSPNMSPRFSRNYQQSCLCL